jgi:hypothetical protein
MIAKVRIHSPEVGSRQFPQPIVIARRTTDEQVRERAQGLWRTGQHEADGPADRDCPVLVGRSPGDLSPVRTPARDRKTDERRRQRAVHALGSAGLTDAIIAVLDAKYHYNFWRPITAIRNGDMDGNPATDREATFAGPPRSPVTLASRSCSRQT